MKNDCPMSAIEPLNWVRIQNQLPSAGKFGHRVMIDKVDAAEISKSDSCRQDDIV